MRDAVLPGVQAFRDVLTKTAQKLEACTSGTILLAYEPANEDLLVRLDHRSEPHRYWGCLELEKVEWEPGI